MHAQDALHRAENSRSLGNPPQPAEIIAARKAANLTQSACAALVHVGREQWAAWESGRYRMPAASWELFRIKSTGKPSKARVTGRKLIPVAQCL